MLIEIPLIILLSYLIGSVSPGYLFGKLIRKIDIRKYGNHNTGATNTFKTVGPVYGVVTAIIDISKGSFSYIMANGLLNSPELAFVSLFSVIGHNYPFYLKFRGGRGVATLAGLGITSIFFTQSLTAFIILLAFVLAKLATAKTVRIIKPSRKIYRLLGFAFPLTYWLAGKSQAFIFILIVTALFLMLDLIRLHHKKFNASLFDKLKSFVKKKEKKSLSTTTYFLISSTLAIYFFPVEIAVISIVFFLIGDTIAEIFGSAHRKFLVGRKSLIGSIVGFFACFLVGVYLSNPLGVNLIFILKGSFFFAALELLSQKADDNLTTPIGTAVLLRIFG